MRAILLCVLLALAAGLPAMGTEIPADEQQPAVTEGQGYLNDAAVENMLAGKLVKKYAKWYVETEDDMIMLELPEASVLRQQECELAKGDEVIVHGRMVKDRLVVSCIEKNGVKYQFSE